MSGSRHWSWRRWEARRHACRQLDSREAGDLYFGDIVKVIDEGMASNGASRARGEAVGREGWVSAKMLEESADVLDASGGALKLTVSGRRKARP